MKALNIPTPKTTLAGFLHPAQLSETISVAASNRVLIISHGFNGAMDGSSKAALLAEQATQFGFHVIRYKFTPCQPLTAQIEELNAVVRYARDQIAPHIYLLGRSMGGSASLAVACLQRTIVKGLCLWATPCDLHATFQAALGADYDTLRRGNSVTFADEYTTITLDGEFVRDFDRYPLLEYARSLAGMPLLVIHGNRDEVVALKQAQTLYAAAGSPKQMVIIDGGGHQFIGKTQEAHKAVLKWLSQRASLL